MDNITPSDFDAAARAAWINITVSAIENMPMHSVNITSVSAFDSSSNHIRRRLNEVNTSSIVNMAISDIMENYEFHDASDFSQFVQEKISDTYSMPESMTTFVDLAVSKGSVTISKTTVITVGSVIYSPPSVSRVLTGAPTSAPSAEKVDLNFMEEIIQDELKLSLSVVGFVVFCLALLFIYVACHHREKESDKENVYNEKVTDVYKDVDKQEVAFTVESPRKVDEQAVRSLSKFDAMMNRSFMGLDPESNDNAFPKKNSLVSPAKKVPRVKIERKQAEKKNPSNVVYESFKKEYIKSLPQGSGALTATRNVSTLNHSSQWDLDQYKSRISRAPPLASPTKKSYSRHLHNLKRDELKSPAQLISAKKIQNSPQRNLKRMALSQSALFSDGKADTRRDVFIESKISLESPPHRERPTATVPSSRNEPPLQKAKGGDTKKYRYQAAASVTQPNFNEKEIVLGSHEENDEWVARYSKRKQRYYWKNTITGKSTWKKPPEYSPAKAHTLNVSDTSQIPHEESQELQKSEKCSKLSKEQLMALI